MSRFGAIEEALFPKKAQPTDDQIERAGHKHGKPDREKKNFGIVNDAIFYQFFLNS